MKSFWLVTSLLISLCAPVQAQFNGSGAFGSPGFRTPNAGCLQSTNFLARTSGLSGAENAAVITMICGLVSDGIITGTLSGATGCGSILDGFYIFATNTTTTANLNICGTSYGLTKSGTVTFAADTGYTGDGSTGDFSTGFVPSSASGNMVLNSATIGAYVLTNRTTNNNSVEIGTSGGGPFLYIQPLTGGNLGAEVNGSSGTVGANTTARGHWTVTRVSSSAIVVYKNGSTSGFGSRSDTSVNLVSGNPITILALSGVGDFSNDQVAASYFGAGLNSTQVAAIDARINAYMTAFGINVH